MGITVKINAVNGTNKYSLLQSQSPEIIDIYENVFAKVEGSLTTVVGNDAISKFNVAIASLQPTLLQNDAINNLKTSFRDIESKIDPIRLNFTIAKALDNEICINRVSEIGVSKIIIHEDGVIAYSFIGFKQTDKQDVLDFFEGIIDYELITYKFFS